MKPRIDRIAFIGATTFAALAGLAVLGSGSGDTPVVTHTQSRPGVATQPIALTTPHPTAALTPRATPTGSGPAATSAPNAPGAVDSDAAGVELLSGPTDQTAVPVAPAPQQVVAPTAALGPVVEGQPPSPDAVGEPKTLTQGPAEASQQDECHPTYVECLPVTDDLNCADIGGPIHVYDIYDDPYVLDADNDGVGCERW